MLSMQILITFGASRLLMCADSTLPELSAHLLHMGTPRICLWAAGGCLPQRLHCSRMLPQVLLCDACADRLPLLRYAGWRLLLRLYGAQLLLQILRSVQRLMHLVL